MYKASNITTFHNVSTNATPIALSDVTTEDLVSIMQNLVKKYGGDTWAPLITELYNHIINHNNPHQVIMEQIETKTIDVVYKQWIAEGYVGSKEDFLSIFFQYVDVTTIDQFDTLLPYLVNSTVEANKDTLETKVPVILLIKKFVDWHNDSLTSHKNLISKIFGDTTRSIQRYVYPDRAISQLCGCGPSPYTKFYEADEAPALTAKNDGMVYGEVPIATMDGTAIHTAYLDHDEYRMTFLVMISLYPTTITTSKQVLMLRYRTRARYVVHPGDAPRYLFTVDYTNHKLICSRVMETSATGVLGSPTIIGRVTFAPTDKAIAFAMTTTDTETTVGSDNDYIKSSIYILNPADKNSLITINDDADLNCRFGSQLDCAIHTDCIQNDLGTVSNPSINQLISFSKIFTESEILSLLQSKCPY